MNTHVIRDCAHDMYDAPRLCGFLMVLCYKERWEKGSGICCLVKTRYHKHARDIVRSSPDQNNQKFVGIPLQVAKIKKDNQAAILPRTMPRDMSVKWVEGGGRWKGRRGEMDSSWYGIKKAMCESNGEKNTKCMEWTNISNNTNMT